ncbi:DUF6624 domain-containing protein [Neokomagataea thailandica]|uniref:DUF4034 domain-containing protein n=1 Tax=Neokomagataea tanensis NBRC 106556 TaxID=1223519 RepID=A0ABQ0QLD1_9PROT|nr:MULTISPECIES: DUF6624 domain-containing protein [Neokomagataea]GBR49198.1 hypothetical protein AA106556_1965 [Neokomagataea tanensis NBRC 106556]
MPKYKALLLSSLTIFLCAAAPPPPSIAPFIKNGTLDTGDYSFARGAFPGATPEQIKNWSSITNYLKQCSQDATSAEESALKKIGVSTHLEKEAYQDHICGQLDTVQYNIKNFKTWEQFQTAYQHSLPYFQAYKMAIDASVNATNILHPSDDIIDQTARRVIPDQAWRAPTLNNFQELSGVDPDSRKALMGRLSLTLRIIDRDNTLWARHVLETKGWSGILKEGPHTAKALWLFIQHADDDPALQVMALRQIEPLAKAGKSSKPDYALMYDRVMLAITGKQHYGSQLSCQNHHYAPYSLDAGAQNPKTLDARRAEMDLPSEAQYLTYLPPHC